MFFPSCLSKAVQLVMLSDVNITPSLHDTSHGAGHVASILHTAHFHRSIMSSADSPVPATRVSFASLTHQNIGTVRKLNSVLFPVKYSDKYYQDILQPELEPFCQLGPSSR